MKHLKASIIINILIFILVTFATVSMFFGLKLMGGEQLLESRSVSMFKYFTVDSNILMGIIAFAFVIFEILLSKKKIKEIPDYMYILKMIGTSAVTLTFLVTLLFLTPQYGFIAMFSNNNLFLHLIVPVLSIITYILIEKHECNLKQTLLGIVPMALYSIYYVTNVIIHFNDGGSPYKYDFYGFVRGNIYNCFISLPIIFIVAFLISYVLVLLNKKLLKK